MTPTPTSASGEPLSRSEEASLRNDWIRRLEHERTKRSWHLEPPSTYADNRHILKLWRPEYDDVLIEEMKLKGLAWHQDLSKVLLDLIPDAEISAWRAKDPLCKQFAYYNLLANFAVARAATTGLDQILPRVSTKTCLACDQEFSTSSLRANVWVAFGTVFCGVCTARAFFIEGDPLISKPDAISNIQAQATALGRTPNQKVSLAEATVLPDFGQTDLVRALRVRPSDSAIKFHFGSWFEALVASDVLDEGAQRMTRGTRCIANDGHVCHSIGEKTVDDLLHAAGIEHSREPSYPTGRMRADFQVGRTLIEFFGLVGNAEYDAKIQAKRHLAAASDVPLIEIYPEDLADPKSLLVRLQRAAADF